jgi:GT2 family glycosyltransferase/SAM-dependent methyltransferase/glycosyltransferase involved in cell wall biosynthesis
VTKGLEFSGERFVPECQREIWYEHWHRYAFCCQFVTGGCLLDIACGEGYGAHLLAQRAELVIGVDISEPAIAHAAQRYGNQSNLKYVVGGCERIPLGTATIDTAVSFETIEHVEGQRELLSELRRVIKPDGLLILSSPNKKVYSDDRGCSNEFHIRELYLNELTELLGEQFGAVRVLGQKLVFHSAIWCASQESGRFRLWSHEDGPDQSQHSLPYEAMYFVTLCAGHASLLPQPEETLWLFGDRSESVYRHYDETVRHTMRLDRLLGEREQLIRERDDLLELRNQQLAQAEVRVKALEEQLALQRGGSLGMPLLRSDDAHSQNKKASSPMNEAGSPQPLVDVVIPIYNAYLELLGCLNSVRRAGCAGYRLVLVDDGSTDPRIGELLRQLEQSEGAEFVLLRNELNLGFVHSVNRAMALSRNDVVLLNSDTVVTRGWLDKLRRCAASDRRIGTITPFTNNGEICSFPRFCEPNPVPEDPELVNRALERAAIPLYPDLPTGVGFCLYIRRALLDRIGLFDAESFGLGYGEENDFCLRALQAGYRNVLCEDTFVVHLGGASFQGETARLRDENLQRLLAKHPRYLDQVHRFIAQDPLKPLRLMAQTQLNLLVHNHKPGVLHILRGKEGRIDRHGGTDGHVSDLVLHMRDHFRQYLLVAQGDDWYVKDMNSGEGAAGYHFVRQHDESWRNYLGTICSWLEIGLIHVHTLLGCREGLRLALEDCGLPYGLTVHDMYLACPTIHLLNETGVYCHANTDSLVCDRCLDAQDLDVGIEDWRRDHRGLVENARFIMAPSVWASVTFRKYFPDAKISVVPHRAGDIDGRTLKHHAAGFSLPEDESRDIGVIGAIGPVKGSRRLERLVQRTREQNLPLRWVVIGYTDRQFEPYQTGDRVLTVHGPYAREEVKRLLDHYHISLVLFPSMGPETFSFALSEAWAAGRPVLVPPIGALAERVQATGAGWIMKDWEDEDYILQEILALTARENRAEFDHKSTLAKQAVPPHPETAMMAIYRSAIRKGGRTGTMMLSASRAYEGLCNQLRIDATLAGAEKTVVRRVTLRVSHYAIRFRYTSLGRLIERNMPPHWHDFLKRLLLP